MNHLYQKGMSTLGMLTSVILVAGGLLLVIKIAPLYIDDWAIGSALESLSTESNLYNTSKREIRKKLMTKMAADYTRDLSEDEVIIKKAKDVMTIDVIYESRVPVVYNLDVVAKFSHHLEVKP